MAGMVTVTLRHAMYVVTSKAIECRFTAFLIDALALGQSSSGMIREYPIGLSAHL